MLWIIQLPIFHSEIMYLHTVCMLHLPATKRIVPISPHIGLVSADAGTSCLTEGDGDTTTVFMDTGNICDIIETGIVTKEGIIDS